MTWHPRDSMLAVVTSLGSVHIWQRRFRERWAAFAPGFDELDRNLVGFLLAGLLFCRKSSSWG